MHVFTDEASRPPGPHHRVQEAAMHPARWCINAPRRDDLINDAFSVAPLASSLAEQAPKPCASGLPHRLTPLTHRSDLLSHRPHRQARRPAPAAVTDSRASRRHKFKDGSTWTDPAHWLTPRRVRPGTVPGGRNPRADTVRTTIDRGMSGQR
jgi:hypothetical protein